MSARKRHFTPKSELIDALGRTVRTTEHNAHFNGSTHESVVMKYKYDIKGQLLEVIDPLDRICFEHKYDTAGNNLWTKHLDSGEKTLAVDAQGKPLYSTDAKGAAVYTAYDGLHRPTDIWAQDATGEDVTLRQHMVYGDSAGLTDPEDLNLKGQLYQHYDEAGKATITEYDFKGNPLEKVRQVIADEELTGTEKYVVDWDGLDEDILDEKEYVTGLLYDGLNRVRKSILPEDVESARKELTPTYNRAGTLDTISLDGTAYVQHIAYNAKGQRILLALGNEVMTRYAYDPLTFRLLRIKSEKYTLNGNDYQPQSGTKRQDTAYVYDLGGNIIKTKERITDCGISGTTLGVDALDRTFGYDPLKHLLQATGRESNVGANKPGGDPPIPGTPNANNVRAYTDNFSYDKVGNLLLRGHVATGNTFNRHYHYASGKNLLEQIDDNAAPPNVYSAFTYNAVGNQTGSNTDRFYQWDAADQLKYFKVEASGSISIEAHYLYAGGQRIKKFVRDQQGNIEVTVYIDGVYEHRYKKNNSGTITDEQTQLHVMDGRSSIATLRLGDDFGDTTPALFYNLEDHLGTSTLRLNSSGAEIDREEYYAFGDSSLRTFDKKRYRYVGKEKDGESGLYYYGARYYAAWVCRFVSVDPLAARYAQLTPYNYAANDPIGDLDIDGMQSRTTEPSSSDTTQTTSANSGVTGGADTTNIGIDQTPDTLLSPMPNVDASTLPAIQGTTPVTSNIEQNIHAAPTQPARSETERQLEANRAQIRNPNGAGTLRSVFNEPSDQGDQVNLEEVLRVRPNQQDNTYVDTSRFVRGSNVQPVGTDADEQEPREVLDSPVGNARISSQFLDRRTCAECSPTHGGTDYSVPVGTDVQATAAGTVVRSWFSNSYGNVVVVDHGASADNPGEHVYTLYAHGSERPVAQGTAVNAGDVVLRSGNTGNSTGPHLHYEVIRTEHRATDRAFFGNLNIRHSPQELRDLLPR